MTPHQSFSMNQSLSTETVQQRGKRKKAMNDTVTKVHRRSTEFKGVEQIPLKKLLNKSSNVRKHLFCVAL